MSRSLYCREFKRLVGETPLSYLTNWRILKSKEFLKEDKKNISEIASKVGYQSEAAFNRLFKAKVGETPASYRRKIIGK
jgi:AraC-like DNA-binding protein